MFLFWFYILGVGRGGEEGGYVTFLWFSDSWQFEISSKTYGDWPLHAFADIQNFQSHESKLH